MSEQLLSINNLSYTYIHLTKCPFPSSLREELEKTTSSMVQGFRDLKEDFVGKVRDDVITLPPDEPIIKGKQGEISCTAVLSLVM